MDALLQVSGPTRRFGAVIIHDGLTAQLQQLPTLSSAISGILIEVLITFLPNGLLGGARAVLQRVSLRRAGRWRPRTHPHHRRSTVRIANLQGRATLIAGECGLDVERASDARFGADPQALWSDWEAFTAWAGGVDVAGHPDAAPFDPADLLAPVPNPSQVFAIGLNYADHAAEASMEVPENPIVFTKFPSSLTGAEATVRLSGDRVDWEAELVIVIGRRGRDIPVDQAWDAVAGLTVGQDVSDRTVQNQGKPAQFNLGKSFEQYSPTGPAVVTVDEIRAAGHDVDALTIHCEVVDEPGAEPRTLQHGTTADLIFPVRQLIARLSAIVELRPGDLIFTGTPSGVGLGRTPQVFLEPGQRLTTEIEGIGTIRQTFVA